MDNKYLYEIHTDDIGADLYIYKIIRIGKDFFVCDQLINDYNFEKAPCHQYDFHYTISFKPNQLTKANCYVIIDYGTDCSYYSYYSLSLDDIKKQIGYLTVDCSGVLDTLLKWEIYNNWI